MKGAELLSSAANLSGKMHFSGHHSFLAAQHLTATRKFAVNFSLPLVWSFLREDKLAGNRL